MMRLCKEVLQTSMKEGVLITIERTLTEEMDSKEVDSMVVISEEIHFKVTLIEVIPIEGITIEEIPLEGTTITNERDQTLIEIPIIQEREEIISSIGVVILVENNHRLPEEARHVPHHLIIGIVVHMVRDQI